MTNIIKEITKEQKRKLPEIRPGDTVRVFEKIKEGPASAKASVGKKATAGKEKGRIKVFEGVVLARKHGNEIGATITVRREIKGIGVEKTLPLHSPTIEKIEVVRKGKVRRAKLYYLRTAKGKRARIKERR